MTELVYKVLREREWHHARIHGVIAGSPIDALDGFIHLSTAAQVQATLDKHFAGERNLYLAAVDAGLLGEDLKWEPSRGGALFPHYYGILPIYAVRWVEAIATDDAGRHAPPKSLA